MNSTGITKIIDCSDNRYLEVKQLNLDIPSSNTDLDIQEESSKFITCRILRFLLISNVYSD